MITFTGWVLSFGPWVILFWFYGAKMNDEDPREIPSLWFYGQAISYFIYRLLDEIDGKHARNTGQSSPLGLFFDHGVDAFSVGFQGIIHARTL